MKKHWIPMIALATVTIHGCTQVKEQAKEAINSGGELVGRSASEFSDGVAKGVSQTMECKVDLSPSLQSAGLQVGKYFVDDSAGTTHQLQAYIIFTKPYKGVIYAKVLDDAGKEYGRAKTEVEAIADAAGFYNFVFDSRTDIERRSVFILDTKY